MQVKIEDVEPIPAKRMVKITDDMNIVCGGVKTVSQLICDVIGDQMELAEKPMKDAKMKISLLIKVEYDQSI